MVTVEAGKAWRLLGSIEPTGFESGSLHLLVRRGCEREAQGRACGADKDRGDVVDGVNEGLGGRGCSVLGGGVGSCAGHAGSMGAWEWHVAAGCMRSKATRQPRA